MPMEIKNRSMRISCAITFCVFTFCYLYFYQTDILSYTQLVASNGQTHYVSWLGAGLITFVLQLLQVCVYSVLKLNKRGHASTYFPSILFLTILTSINSNGPISTIWDTWIWLAPLLLVLYFIIAFSMRRYEPYEPELRNVGFASQLLWINLGIMNLLFLMVGLYSNSDRIFHEKMKIESLVLNRQYNSALRNIQRMQNVDSATTMLTIYCVAREGHLPDSLYEYRLLGGKDVLRPGKVHSMLLPDCIINKATARSVHYQLNNYLLDRNLLKFIQLISEYYPTDSLRPRYYAEAYKLYTLLSKGLKPKYPYAKGSYTNYYFSTKN